MTSSIERFTGPYSFLGNSYQSIMSFRGSLFPTAEHAFQSTKATSPDEYRIIKGAKSPGDARRLGRCILLQDGWIESQVHTMEEVLRSKFENPFLAQMLIETHPAQLLHCDTRSTFWGIVDGIGENHLGLLLMKVRDNLRERGFL